MSIKHVLFIKQPPVQLCSTDIKLETRSTCYLSELVTTAAAGLLLCSLSLTPEGNMRLSPADECKLSVFQLLSEPLTPPLSVTAACRPKAPSDKSVSNSKDQNSGVVGAESAVVALPVAPVLLRCGHAEVSEQSQSHQPHHPLSVLGCFQHHMYDEKTWPHYFGKNTLWK